MEMKQNKVVVHFRDGRLLKGHCNDFRPNKPDFHLETPGNETPLIRIEDLKAVFFVKDHDGDEHCQHVYEDEIPGAGRKARVSFSDGEEIIGYVSSYSPDRIGFFLIPAELEGNNERIFIAACSCARIDFL